MVTGPPEARIRRAKETWRAVSKVFIMAWQMGRQAGGSGKVMTIWLAACLGIGSADARKDQLDTIFKTALAIKF